MTILKCQVLLGIDGYIDNWNVTDEMSPLIDVKY